MKRNIQIWALSGLMLAFPLALSADEFGRTKDLLIALMGLVRLMTILAAGIALLVFIWGLAKFILKANDEKSHTEGKSLMVWGVIALFVMVSVWGIVAFIQSELGVYGSSQQNPPAVPGTQTPFEFDRNRDTGERSI